MKKLSSKINKKAALNYFHKNNNAKLININRNSHFKKSLVKFLIIFHH